MSRAMPFFPQFSREPRGGIILERERGNVRGRYVGRVVKAVVGRVRVTYLLGYT
jgi:hypothetical protein